MIPGKELSTSMKISLGKRTLGTISSYKVITRSCKSVMSWSKGMGNWSRSTARCSSRDKIRPSSIKAGSAICRIRRIKTNSSVCICPNISRKYSAMKKKWLFSPRK